MCVCGTSCGRLSCWQWGRPPKQVKENFLLKNTDPLLSSLLSLATWCRALRGRTRAARPGTATRRWSCEKRAGGRGSCHGVARGAAKAHTIRQRRAICDARGGLERVLVRRDIECCSGTAWQAYAATSLQRQRWNYGAGLERQTHRAPREPQACPAAAAFGGKGSSDTGREGLAFLVTMTIHLDAGEQRHLARPLRSRSWPRDPLAAAFAASAANWPPAALFSRDPPCPCHRKPLPGLGVLTRRRAIAVMYTRSRQRSWL